MRYVIILLAAAAICLSAQLWTGTTRTHSEMVKASMDIEVLTHANKSLPMMAVADPI
jgi:hypothetical protein